MFLQINEFVKSARAAKDTCLQQLLAIYDRTASLQSLFLFYFIFSFLHSK